MAGRPLARDGELTVGGAEEKRRLHAAAAALIQGSASDHGSQARACGRLGGGVMYCPVLTG